MPVGGPVMRTPGFGGGPMPVGEPPLRVGGFGGNTMPDPNPLAAGRPVLGTMHKGGKIKKTGLYNMKKGEKVVPAKGKLTAKDRASAFRQNHKRYEP
jgi:hypothetical protein